MLMLLASVMYAQTTRITGLVRDRNGTGIAGASVMVKGTNNGVTTDASGNFTIDAPTGATLVITSVNFAPKEIKTGSDTRYIVSMDAANEQMNEVVVIGYGLRRKGDVTGAISSVSARNIERNTNATAQLALQGTVPGVLALAPSGNPNARPNIRIRGVNTFNGVNDPLYVIDGVPLVEGVQGSRNATQQDVGGPVNLFSFINPNDIESISILKDGSASAIYGVRASNGVILITTKKGRTGKPRIQANAYYGIQNSVAKKQSVLNVSQYVALYREAYANNPAISGGNPVPFGNPIALGPEFSPDSAGYLGNKPTINWQDAYFNKNAPVSDVSVRISGATESFNYYVSTGLYKTQGTLVGSEKDRYTLSTNLSTKISRIIEAGLTSTLAYENSLDQNISDLGTSLAPPWQAIYGNGPHGFQPVAQFVFGPNSTFDPSKDDPGPIKNTLAGYPRYLWGKQTQINPFGFNSTRENRYYTATGLGNAYVQLNLFKGFKLRGSLGGSYSYMRNDSYTEFEDYLFSKTINNPYVGIYDSTVVANLNLRHTYQKNFLKEATANYNRTFGTNHNVDLTLVANEQTLDWTFASSSGPLFTTDKSQRKINGGGRQRSGGAYEPLRRSALIGYAGRASYNYASKYYVDVTVRRDGSSLLAPNNRWGTFPSVGLGWRITSEKFMMNKNLSWLNDLKLRGSWSETGNIAGTQGFAYVSLTNPGTNNIPIYSFGSGSGNGVGSILSGVYFPTFANTELSWETLVSTGLGFDAVLFNNKMNLTVEYYNKLNKDIIQSVAPPLSAGIGSNPDLNVGSVRNRGMEFEVTYNDKIGPVNFSVNANLTTVKNEVIKLNGGNPFASNVREGYPLYFIYGYKVGGIFQSEAEIDAWMKAHSDVTVGQTRGNLTAGRPKPGDIYFQDVNGKPDPKFPSAFNSRPDSLITADDQTIIGKTIPGYYYGFGINANFRGFDLAVQTYGVGDVQKINYYRMAGESMSTPINQLATTLNRWTSSNKSTSMPRAAFDDPNKNNRFSDRFVENGSFLRFKVIQVGYTIPKNWLARTGFVEGFRLYVSGINLFTITKYSGFDPETDNYPVARQVTFGVNASF